MILISSTFYPEFKNAPCKIKDFDSTSHRFLYIFFLDYLIKYTHISFTQITIQQIYMNIQMIYTHKVIINDNNDYVNVCTNI